MAISEESFLRAFFDENECVCIRAFADRKDKELKPIKYSFQLKDLQKYLPKLRVKNEEGYGIHFVVNYGGHSDKKIKRINAIFFENDKLTLDEQLKKISESPLEPSVIVKTSRSLHAYFLVKDVPVNKFRELQERVAFFFNSDTQLKNESHTMRMPNFYHMKDEPILVVVVKFDPEIKYSFNEIDTVFPKIPSEIKKKKRKYVPLSKYDGNFVVSYVRERLNIKYERDDKIVCQCLFPEKHVHGDAYPSAVFFKDSLYFHCSACGITYRIDELAQIMQWNDLLETISKKRFK